MFHEPPTLEVCINRVAVKTFARRYYKDLVNAVNLKGMKEFLILDRVREAGRIYCKTIGKGRRVVNLC